MLAYTKKGLQNPGFNLQIQIYACSLQLLGKVHIVNKHLQFKPQKFNIYKGKKNQREVKKLNLEQ